VLTLALAADVEDISEPYQPAIAALFAPNAPREKQAVCILVRHAQLLGCLGKADQFGLAPPHVHTPSQRSEHMMAGARERAQSH